MSLVCAISNINITTDFEINRLYKIIVLVKIVRAVATLNFYI